MTKVKTTIITGVYTIDESTKKDFPVAAIAGRGTSGDVYYTDDMGVVLKLDKRNLDDEVRESIRIERKNLAQIDELFGVYTEDNNPAITLMRGYTGKQLNSRLGFLLLFVAIPSPPSICVRQKTERHSIVQKNLRTSE
jgi:hypothetical protein